MATPSVLKELREVLKETRQPPGRAPVAGYDAVSARYPAGGENAVRRFEKEETSPAYENIDAMVGAYAEATSTSIFDLWNEAIKRAKKGGKAKPTDNPSTVATAAGEKLRGKTEPKGRRRKGS